MTDRETIDTYAREEVRQQRRDHSALVGVVLRIEASGKRTEANVDLILDAIRSRANGRQPSLADLVEEATNPDLRRPTSSNPVKAALERGIGRVVIWSIVSMVAGYLGNEGIRWLTGHH